MASGGLVARVPVMAMFAIAVAGIVFTALAKAAELSHSTDATLSGDEGNLTITGSSCSGVFQCGGKVLGFIGGVFSFDIDGAPTAVRFVVTTFYVLTLVLCIITIAASVRPGFA